jgi:predicted nucleotidyltransferase
MKNIILEQLIYEVETWKRLIVFIKNENLMRINRLNEIIKSNDDKNILNKIENFQVQFLTLEEIFYILNNEVAVQGNRLMLVHKKEYEIDIILLIKQQQDIRLNMEKLINKINKIKSDFFQEFSEKLYQLS